MNIEDKIREQYEEGVSNVHKVYNIFKEFFGEDKVDLQQIPSLDAIYGTIRHTSLGTYMRRSDFPFAVDKTRSVETRKFFDLSTEDQETILNSANICTRVVRYEDITHRPFILVHFPEVRVTNEHDRYVDIKDLYARVSVGFSGEMCGSFALNRATYSLIHLVSNYMHSHIQGIPRGSYSHFQSPCTGSGPINDTMCSLKDNGYDYDLWNLFCLELSKYVTVESLTGVPYRRLEDIGARSLREMDSDRFEIHKLLPREWASLTNEDGVYATRKLFKDFILYAIASNKIKYGYSYGCYTLGMSYREFIITISNLFIDWYNKKYNEHANLDNPLPTFDRLKGNSTLLPCKISGNKIYSEHMSIRVSDYIDDIGKFMCKFKGKNVNINITDLEELPNQYSYLLNPSLVGYIAWKLMETINFEYGNRDKTYASGDKALEGRRYF